MGIAPCEHSTTNYANKLKTWPLAICYLWTKTAVKKTKCRLDLALMARLLHTSQSSRGVVLAWRGARTSDHMMALPWEALNL